MRPKALLSGMFALFALILMTGGLATGNGDTEANTQIQNSPPTEEILFGADCWAPGEPGGSVLPPCDPNVVPSARPVPVSTTTFEALTIEFVPRWWEVWKPGWSLCSD